MKSWSAYLPEFVEEGTIHDRPVILPLAKSTEILFVNKTAFDRFAAETGASLNELATWEGCTPWRSGMRTGRAASAFFVLDYHFNYFQVGVESLGEDFFDKNGIAFGPKFAYAWEPYARAALTGGLWLRQRLRHRAAAHRRRDRVRRLVRQRAVLFRRGDLCRTTVPEQVEIVSLPCPIFEDGEKLVMQRGVGVCTVKSTPEREKACMTFLKWLTEPERNVDFVTILGYMPVTKEAL